MVGVAGLMHALGVAVLVCNIEENAALVTDETQGVPKRSLRRAKERELNPPLCDVIAEQTHSSFFSSCANDIYFPGHKTPPDGERSDEDPPECDGREENECRSTFGCMFADGICVSTVDNSYCNQFLDSESCIDSPADVCYWSSVLDSCQSRYQDCSRNGPEECTAVDGCMWFNDLENGHQVAPASIFDQRGRCLADPCFRINNGKCTIQHTGGRCVWYTQDINFHSNFQYPGCYTSPCNNRFNRRSCIEQNDPEVNPGPYKCIFCRETTNSRGQTLKLGCQNAEQESTAQCWNILGRDRNYPLPVPENDECRRCIHSRAHYTEAFADGKCHFDHLSGTTKAVREATCAEKCCQSSLCTCMNQRGDDDARDDGRDAGLDINGATTPRPTTRSPTERPSSARDSTDRPTRSPTTPRPTDDRR